MLDDSLLRVIDQMFENRRVVEVTRDHIQTAIREGIPFVIKMADGEKYEVTESQKIALGGTYAMVVDQNDLPHVLPLLTMTGISTLKPSP